MRSFECEACGGTFTTEQTDAEAFAESRARDDMLRAPEEKREASSVCGDCFRLIAEYFEVTP